MRRSNVELTATAAGLQIASLVILMLGVLGILAHNVAYSDRPTTAAASQHQQAARSATFNPSPGL